jgi:DNA phosphorothioation-associated putative methyltransferase
MTYPTWLDYKSWETPRWKTSIVRKSLSVPARTYLNYLDSKKAPILDFGCGRGSYDVNNLIAKGFNAKGYDPYYKNNLDLLDNSYQHVMLLYVINVIESKQERAEVLRYAWNLTDLSLIIAVRTDSKGEVYTKSGTFQKYFTSKTLVEFINKALYGYNYQIKYQKGGVIIIERETQLLFNFTNSRQSFAKNKL